MSRTSLETISLQQWFSKSLAISFLTSADEDV
jgi:hypothetical protein